MTKEELLNLVEQLDGCGLAITDGDLLAHTINQMDLDGEDLEVSEEFEEEEEADCY